MAHFSSWAAGQGRHLRIAVLGASGFIGTWVSRLLLENGFHPHLFCRSANQKGWGESQAEHVIESDLLEGGWEILSREPFDVVFNLLGYGVAGDQREYSLAYRINAFLPAMCASLPGRPFVVHVGSALEYGDVRGDLSEETVPNPTTLYGYTKLLGTYRFLDNLHSGAVRGVVARLFMIYGPGELEPRLLPTLISASKTGRSVPLTEGLQRRDFTYVVDAAEGLIRMGLSRCGDGEIINLCTGTLTSVREFAETAARLLELSPEQLHIGKLPTRGEEMQHEPVNNGKLQRLLDWKPTLNIEEGIGRTLDLLAPPRCEGGDLPAV